MNVPRVDLLARYRQLETIVQERRAIAKHVKASDGLRAFHTMHEHVT